MEQIKAMLTAYTDRVLELLPEDRLPGRVVPVTPGIAPAFDDCSCGFLYGRLVGINPAAPSARPAGGAGIPCRVPFLMVTLGLGMVRCAHTLDDDGNPPTAEEVFEDGAEMLADMHTLQQALLHEDAPTRDLNAWIPLDDEGGCHGGEWQFTVRIDLALPDATPGPAGLGA